MNEHKSHFRDELAIIPPVATVIAVLAFVLVQICLLGLLPHYERDIPPMAALVPISIFGGIVVAIIILLIGYVNADSKRRGMNSLLWTLLVIFVPKALGFIAYFLLRKPLLLPCPNCQWTIGSDFRFCPKCGHALTPSCNHCGHAVSRDYVVCPYCGKPIGAAAVTG
jgi:RNA polymerase subunit RPABC4/transcription elongation factor Spt4